VLIADDNRDAADTLADILRHLGCDVAVAYDGGEAVELARSFVPELVFLDIGMPILDGYETARRIRSDAGERPVKLVALTGWGQADDRQRGREAGFDEHLVKPATFESVRAMLPSATR
jgi:CheY-like chemotaxis protein